LVLSTIRENAVWKGGIDDSQTAVFSGLQTSCASGGSREIGVPPEPVPSVKS
jgi:hypothetical protein